MMNFRNTRCIPSFTLCLLLSGCEAKPVEGDYVTFVRDMMEESARFKEESGQGTERSESAEKAVRAWRGRQEEAPPP